MSAPRRRDRVIRKRTAIGIAAVFLFLLAAACATARLDPYEPEPSLPGVYLEQPAVEPDAGDPPADNRRRMPLPPAATY